MANTSTQFILTQEPNAILRFRGKDYNGYVLINHEDGATATQQKVVQFKRIAHCHPSLSNNFLVFDTLPLSLSDLLVKTTFLDALKSNKDLIKQLFKSLALVGLRAYEEGLKVDTTLENIYCNEDDNFILVKCIALKSDNVEFVDWKKEILDMYENIKKKVGDDRMFTEYNNLKELLGSSNTAEDFRSNLQSWIFWSTRKRLNVIYKITGMTTKWGQLFANYCGGAKKIVGWRQRMSQDASLAIGVNGCKQNIFLNRPDCLSYKNEEVYLFLTFLRASVSHFSTFGDNTFKSEFKSEEELVRHLDMRFNDIMGEVYEGCAIMEKSNTYYFGIDLM